MFSVDGTKANSLSGIGEKLEIIRLNSQGGRDDGAVVPFGEKLTPPVEISFGVFVEGNMVVFPSDCS